MTALNCVDVSKWGGDLTATEAECMKSSGIETVVVASGPGGYGIQTEQQALAVLAAGMVLEIYTYLEFEQDPSAWADHAVAALRSVPKGSVARWWIDVEDTANGVAYTPAQRALEVDQCIDRFELHHDIRPHIYSGRWYWDSRMIGINHYAADGRWLWNSWYDDDPDPDGLPYGGWTVEQLAIEQYAGTSIVCGQSVDKNHLYIPAATTTPGPTPWEVNARDIALQNEAVLMRVEVGAVEGNASYQAVQDVWRYARSKGYIPDRTQ